MRLDTDQRSRSHDKRVGTPAGREATPPLKQLMADGLFWSALLGGPVVWALAWSLTDSQFGWPRAWATVALVALFYPIIEEILFRGFLQGWLRHRTQGRRLIGPITIANAITATAFALTHLVHHPPLLAAGVFIPGLVFGFFRDRYGGIVPGTALHCFYNAGWFLLAAG